MLPPACVPATHSVEVPDALEREPLPQAHSAPLWNRRQLVQSTWRTKLGMCTQEAATSLAEQEESRGVTRWTSATPSPHSCRKGNNSLTLTTSCYNFQLLCTLQLTDWLEVPFSLRRTCKPLCFHGDMPSSGERFHREGEGAKTGSANHGTAVTPEAAGVEGLG